MITVCANRFKGKEKFHLSAHQRAAHVAFKSLVRGELAWNAKVIHLHPEKIAVETEVLRNVDITTFEGKAEEMRPLLEVAYFYSSINRQRVFSHVADQICPASALIVTTYGVMMLGQSLAKIALITFLCKDDIQAGEKLAKKTLDEVTAMAELVVEFGMSCLEELL